MPAKHAAPSARLLRKVLCPPLRALVSCGLADRKVTRKYTRVSVGLRVEKTLLSLKASCYEQILSVVGCLQLLLI